MAVAVGHRNPEGLRRAIRPIEAQHTENVSMPGVKA